ncbi:ABC transporter permease subunit [Candidatus Aerophobetes bacterium]|nr:ABC transporter permease subunit [Candidatus Aerophobetes bacterium]
MSEKTKTDYFFTLKLGEGKKKKREKKGHRIFTKENAGAILIFIGVVLTIEYGFTFFKVPEWIIPKPSSIFSCLVANFWQIFFPQLLVTLKELFIGFPLGAIIGFTVAALLSEYKSLEKMVVVYIFALACTPTIVLVPILILWLGIGATTRIIVVMIASFPPLMVNAISGFNSASELRLDLMRSLGATRIQTFLKVKFLSGLPIIFSGLILSIIIALITLIGAEFLGGASGLGYLVLYYSSLLQTRMSFAAILLITALGVSFYAIIRIIGIKVITWSE